MTRHSAWFDVRRLLVWSLANAGLVACGALEGGQSGTDSLEAIGVNKPLMKCEEDNTTHDTGERVLRNDGCEECVCQGNGKWKCTAVEACTGAQGADADQSTDENLGTGGAQETAQTDAPDTETGVDVNDTSSESTDDPDDTEQICDGEQPEPSIGGSNGVYVAKDPDASVCVTRTSPTELCMVGWTVDAGEDYANWGGGFGLVMASEDEGTVTPFDATSRGITSVRFTLSGVNDFVLRAYVNQVDDPTIEDELVNYQQNSFVLLETSTSGTFTVPLASATLPAWTLLDTDGDGMSNPEATLDATRLNSLQFFVAAKVGPGSGFEFDVCVTDLEWFDDNGNSVIPTE